MPSPAGSNNPAKSSDIWHQMLGRVSSANSPELIEQALRAYVETWRSGDVEARLALFADDVVTEDPASVLQASNKDELTQLLAGGMPSDWILDFSFERVAVVGDEAILTYRLRMTAGAAEPATLLINAHVVFNGDGLIQSFRTFFDSNAIAC